MAISPREEMRIVLVAWPEASPIVTSAQVNEVAYESAFTIPLNIVEVFGRVNTASKVFKGIESVEQ